MRSFFNPPQYTLPGFRESMPETHDKENSALSCPPNNAGALAPSSGTQACGASGFESVLSADGSQNPVISSPICTCLHIAFYSQFVFPHLDP